MKRFQDCWVVDRTMFEYVSQGGCSCCGISHTLMNLSQLTQDISDWETDDEKKERNSPWPDAIHEDVLTERSRVRIEMKEEMSEYQHFFEEHEEAFAAWWKSLSIPSKLRLLQIEDSEIMNYFKMHLKVKGSYEIVLNAVLEQVERFNETGYIDGRNEVELLFEENLKFRKGVFSIETSFLSKDDQFLALLHLLGGPKLLPLRTEGEPLSPSSRKSDQPEDADVQSFRSDRRIVRLVLLRLFFSILKRSFSGRDQSASKQANDEE